MEKDDFDSFVNADWKSTSPIPDKYARWGCFESLFEETNPKIKQLVSEGGNENLTSLYQSGIEPQDGYENAKPYLQTIDSLNMEKALWYCEHRQIPVFFSLYASQDSKKSDIVVPHLYAGGIGLPDRDYYFDDDKEEIRTKYKEYIKNLLMLYSGNDEKDAGKTAQKIYEIEEQLAKVHYTKVEKRDPHKSYNIYTFDELVELCPYIDWDMYFKYYTSKYEPISYLIVDNPKFYKELSSLIRETLRSHKTGDNFWKVYMKYSFINSVSSFLGDEFVDLRFNFFHKLLRGQKENKPRWERVLAVCDTALGEQIGKLYVEKYFPETSKTKMLEMVNFLHKVLKDRILDLVWMSKKTKESALLKHAAFKNKIGYTDKWKDYSSLNITDNRLTYLDKCLECEMFNFNLELDKFYNPPDMTEWEMDPHTINAYFHPTKNEIVFPAAILQPPFFSPDFSDARNFGAIGTVIAHEFTHSFDDEGRKYDHNGNLVDWWTEEDLKNFMERADYFKDEYSSFTVNGKNVNGKLTLGENLADHGGVKIAYYALKEWVESKGEEFTDGVKKEFFKSWAIVWRQNIREAEADRLITVDPHSPARWRINGTLANVTEFHETYGLKEGDKMYRENVPKIW